MMIVKTAQSEDDPLSRFEEIPEGQDPWAEAPEEAPDEGVEIPPREEEPSFKVEPAPEHEPMDPSMIAEEVIPPETDIDQINADASVDNGQRIYEAITRGTGLKITYTSLPRENDPVGSTTIRVVDPSFVYWAGTNREILVAWCRLRNDWRQFATDQIAPMAELTL